MRQHASVILLCLAGWCATPAGAIRTGISAKWHGYQPRVQYHDTHDHETEDVVGRVQQTDPDGAQHDVHNVHLDIGADKLAEKLGQLGPPLEDPPAGTQPAGAAVSFLHSLFMILATEFGDETFIVAALMAMRHPKFVVFAGAISALTIMTVISTALGYVVPNLISRQATGLLAGCLYTFFGLRLMYIAWQAGGGEAVEEEIHEVEEKLARKHESRWRRVARRFCTPVFLEAFVLTFVAEWGDRSQIATISLAAHDDPFGVTFGAVAGHTLCTGAACLGGELLARRISPRTMAVAGGVLFFLFAAHQFWSASWG